MTKRFDVNRALDNLGDGVGRLIDLLTTYGWTVAGAGNGTNYSNSASTYYNRTVLSGSSNSGAACWVRIDHTATGRELLFYRGASNYHSWVVSYSRSAGFTGGSPSGTVPPTATDQQYMVGSASTTVAVWLNSTDHANGTFHGNFCVDDASPYGFYMTLVNTGNGRSTRGGHIVMDPLTGVSPANTDPYVFYVPMGDAATGAQWAVSATNSSTNRSPNNGASNMWAYNGASWAQVNMYTLHSYASTTAYHLTAIDASGEYANDPYQTLEDTAIPLFIGDAGATGGSYLGNTTWILQSLYQVSSRSQGNLLDIDSTGDYVYIGPNNAAGTAPFAIPWNGGSWTS